MNGEWARYGSVMLPITEEVVADAAPEALRSAAERWLMDWCADNGALRLQGPPWFGPVDNSYASFAMVWPVLT